MKESLKCQLVLEERVANSYRPDASGSNYLFGLLGVEAVRVVKGGTGGSPTLYAYTNVTLKRL